MAEGDIPGRMNRTESDIFSGQNVSSSYERYPNFTNAELDRHFEQFKQYDLNDTGFITTDELGEVLKALDIEVTPDQVANIIIEAGVLSGVSNDGKLSFRNYMDCMVYETDAKVHNDTVNAAEEIREECPEAADAAIADLMQKSSRISLRDSIRDSKRDSVGDESSVCSDAKEEELDEVPVLRMRQSSLAIVNSIVKSRLSSFKQKEESSAPVAVEKPKSKFDQKLQKFHRIEDPIAKANFNNEELNKATLKNKLAAFEQMSKKAPDTFKKSWRTIQHGSWKQKTVIMGGVAPKKSMKDLLAEGK